MLASWELNLQAQHGKRYEKASDMVKLGLWSPSYWQWTASHTRGSLLVTMPTLYEQKQSVMRKIMVVAIHATITCVLQKFKLGKGFPGGTGGREHLPMQETWETRVRSRHQEYSLGDCMATHSSILAWRIPQTEEPGSLQSIGLQRVEHDWSDLARSHKLSNR